VSGLGRHFLPVAWALAAWAMVATAAESRPNILFILTDDQSPRSIGCYPEAYPWVRTPHIDRLAAGGIRFAPAYIGANCIPARATLLTGLHSTGITSLTRRALAASAKGGAGPTYWPRVFRAHGYHTAQIGKWHTDGGTGYGIDWDYQAVWSRVVGSEEFNLNYQRNQLISVNGGKPTLTDGYSTDNYTRWAVDYIRSRQRDREKPWYLWLCFDAPHGPFIPAERHRNEYADVAVPTPADIYPPRPGKPAYMQAVATWVPGANGIPRLRESHYRADSVLRRHAKEQQFPSELPDWVRRYQQTVCAVDESVGTLLQTLDETDQRKNTLIVFASDQGLAIGQHGFFDKHAPYDANVASPLIFNFPGRIAAGAVCPTPVAGVDLIPTFFRFAEIELPWKMDGHDLTPLLENSAARWPHPALLVYTIGAWGEETLTMPAADRETVPERGFRVPWYVSLRMGNYKYIRTLVENEIEEVYDVSADPNELNNLALDLRHDAALQRLRAATLAELRRVDAKFVDRLPSTKTTAASR
jgi:arylsulfatase A-like enzyme